ncbi:hypothetical protein KIW84_031952 [Lathyrus oleraceus]|uniref:Uncharacterized protein n=1 Tax=Pisum sativum TaxID=3888 RepID=A0A9D4XS33_PEA|nr:hypothetical protein KIW84_031952 [Pisum sativum]
MQEESHNEHCSEISTVGDIGSRGENPICLPMELDLNLGTKMQPNDWDLQSDDDIKAMQFDSFGRSQNSLFGSASVSNVGPTGLKNSNVNNLNQDEDEDDDGWEFKSAERETGNENLNDKIQTPKHGNGAVGVGALLDSSAVFSDKVVEWNPGFEFRPISASHSLQLGPKSESNETGVGFTMFNQAFGKLENAHSWPGSNQTLEAPKRIIYIPLLLKH